MWEALGIYLILMFFCAIGIGSEAYKEANNLYDPGPVIIARFVAYTLLGSAALAAFLMVFLVAPFYILEHASGVGSYYVR